MPAEFQTLLRARFPLIWLDTTDEDRVTELACAVALKQGDAVAAWSQTWGLHDVPGPPSAGSHPDPMSLLKYIRSSKRRTLWLLKDIGALCTAANLPLVRALKDTAQAARDQGSVIVCVNTMAADDQLVSDVATRHTLALPTADDHAKLLRSIAKQLALPLEKEAVSMLSQACLGLSLTQAENIWARVRASGGRFSQDDVKMVLSEKARIVRGSGYLQFIEPIDMGQVGGLDLLKQWVVRRGLGFSEKARALGLPYPRGVLLVGVQGCGKSLIARAVAGQWAQPLLRMDVGALMDGLVGSSERNLRNALDLTTRISPCVLWIDEIEKAFSSTDAASDGGTSLRMLGTILTWMQERTAPVFLLATANDVSGLPPELMRKGRFDEIFFVDLPSPEQRRDIWGVHLRDRARAADDNALLSRIDIDALVDESNGYSGAEIAAAVVEGAFEALATDRPLDGAHIAAALRASPPLSRLRAEDINALRDWARQRARAAG